MKKIAILIAVLMALGFFPGAVAAETTNLYTNNADFETWNDSKCTGWSGSSGAWGTTLSESTEIKHGGEKALKMLPDEGKSVYVYQPATVLPGTEYAFSFWFYGMADKTNAGNVEIAFEYRNADNKSAGPTVRVKPEISGNETWLQLSASTETPLECVILRAVLYIHAPGGGYADDASLIKTGEPKYGEASTDRIYYYKEEIRSDSEGEAVVTLNPYYTPENYTADAALYGPDGTLLAESEREQFSEDGKAVLPYSLEGLTELKKAYTVEARIYAADAAAGAAPLWSEEKAVYTYNRPLTLDGDGNYRRMQCDAEGNPLLVNGEYVVADEIFQPTLAYHVSQPKADTQDVDNMYLQAQNAGVNVVQLSHYYSDPARIEAALDVCADYGLMALVCLYRSNVPAGNVTDTIKNSRGEYTTNAENTKEVVEIAKNHPATFAYAVKDEPFSHMTPTMYEDLKNSYKIIRDIDDVHPVYIVDTADVVTLPKYTDICAIDPYPKSPALSGTEAAYHTARAVEAAKGQKPVYVILQAFCYGDTDSNGVHDYFPAWAEIRHMWYQSLAAGAKAVGYYAFDDPWGEIGDKVTTINETAVVWSGMTEFAKSEMEKSYEFFRETTLLESYENDGAWVQTRTKNEETYAVVLSKSSSAQEAFDLQAAEGGIVEVCVGTADTVQKISADTWTLQPAGSSVDIYRMQSTGMFLRRGGQILDAVVPGEVVSAEAVLHTESSVPVFLCAAFYEEPENGAAKLSAVQILASGSAVGGTLVLSGALTIPAEVTAEKVKLIALSQDLRAIAEPAAARIEY